MMTIKTLLMLLTDSYTMLALMFSPIHTAGAAICFIYADDDFLPLRFDAYDSACYMTLRLPPHVDVIEPQRESGCYAADATPPRRQRDIMLLLPR